MRANPGFDEFLTRQNFELAVAESAHPNPASLRHGLSLFYQLSLEIPFITGNFPAFVQHPNPSVCAQVLIHAMQQGCLNLMVIRKVVEYHSIELLHSCLSHVAVKYPNAVPELLYQIPTPDQVTILLQLFTQETAPRISDIDSTLNRLGIQTAWREQVEFYLRLLRKQGLHTAAVEALMLDHPHPEQFTDQLLFMATLPFAATLTDVAHHAFHAPNGLVRVLESMHRKELLNAARCQALLMQPEMTNRIDTLLTRAPDLLPLCATLLDQQTDPNLLAALDMTLPRFRSPELFEQLILHADPRAALACLRSLIFFSREVTPANAQHVLVLATLLTPFPSLLPKVETHHSILAVLQLIHAYHSTEHAVTEVDSLRVMVDRMLSHPSPAVLVRLMPYAEYGWSMSKALLDALLVANKPAELLEVFQELYVTHTSVLNSCATQALLRHPQPKLLGKCLKLLDRAQKLPNNRLVNTLATRANISESVELLRLLWQSDSLTALDSFTLNRVCRTRHFESVASALTAITNSLPTVGIFEIQCVLDHPAPELLDRYLTYLQQTGSLNFFTFDILTKPLESKRIPARQSNESSKDYASRVIKDNLHWREVHWLCSVLAGLRRFREKISRETLAQLWLHPNKDLLHTVLKRFRDNRQLPNDIIDEILSKDHWLAAVDAKERIKTLNTMVRDAGFGLPINNMALVLASSMPEQRLNHFLRLNPLHPQHNRAAQNTHTRSIHRSAAASATRLVQRYQIPALRTDIEPMLQELVEWAEQLHHPQQPLVLRAVNTLIKDPEDPVEPISNLHVTQLLVAVFRAIQDRTTCLTPFAEAESAFIMALFEIQRGYNLDDEGNDLGDLTDLPLCTGGTFNKLVEKMVSIHPDCQLVYLTPEEAGNTLKRFADAAITAWFAQQDAAQQDATLNRYADLDTRDAITNSLWQQIETAVATSLFAEFGDLYEQQRQHPRFIELLAMGGPVAVDDFLDQQLGIRQTTQVGLFAHPAPSNLIDANHPMHPTP